MVQYDSAYTILGVTGTEDRQRTEILQTPSSDTESEFWQGKILTRCLNDYVDLRHGNDAVRTVDFSRVERLFRSKFTHKKVQQYVVTIRAVVLLDGTIVRFKVQHPFGDSEGIPPNPSFDEF